RRGSTVEAGVVGTGVEVEQGERRLGLRERVLELAHHRQDDVDPLPGLVLSAVRQRGDALDLTRLGELAPEAREVMMLRPRQSARQGSPKSALVKFGVR